MSSGGFTGGKLKLKGGEPLKGGVKKKKKKSTGGELALASAPDGAADGAADGDKAKAGEPVRARDGFVLPELPADADRRTTAERKHEERLRALEEERLKKQAVKGYRERVKEFNEHLQSLSEHHDIPKPAAAAAPLPRLVRAGITGAGGCPGSGAGSFPGPSQQLSQRGQGVRASAAAGAAGAPAARIFPLKVGALALIFLCATVNYTVLQSLRDAIIVTSCGAEALPLITAFGVLPASLAFFVYFDTLNKRLPPRAVFHAALAPLAAFFALFAAVLLPNAHILHPVAAAERCIATLPDSLACFVRVGAHWTFALFFIVAELWGSVAISLLFWSLADDVCSVEEAKDVYPKLGILANVGLIAAGSFTRFVGQRLAGGDERLALQLLICAVLVVTACMSAVRLWMDSAVFPHVTKAERPPKPAKAAKAGAPAGGEKRQGTMELLRSSPRILNLTLLVMGYGISHKLFGFAWKGQMKALYPSTTQYATVMGDVASFTGAATVCLMLVSKFFFQRLGWRGAALMTPLVCLASGAVFFAGSMVPAGAAVPGSLLAALVAVFGRSAKYSLFDPAKEMVFITMDRREKEAGKAAVDVLGNSIAKSGGSWLMQAALLATGSMAAALPFTAVVFVGVCLLWLNATLELAKTMDSTEHEETVLASVDGTPVGEPVMPGRLKLPPRPAGMGGGAPAADLGDVAAAQAALDKETKQSMQTILD
ncbi:AATP2 [Scenedesmus sp. PABB004]|nr:AATP2 [Scenedesmus sp. PABB004]